MQTTLQKQILYVAYHFPPQSGSSGLLRSLKFCRYLPENGWMPTVLSVNPIAYERVEQSLLQDVLPEVSVVRTFALDTRRHLSVKNRYASWMALPDRWVSWCLTAIPAGLIAIFRKRVDLIFTTFPIATAVLIGLILHRLTGKPWVVDLRDSMTEDDYPRDERTRRVYRKIESQAVRRGSLFLFTAKSTIDMYLKRYPDLHPEKCILLPNGYDEEDFASLPRAPMGPAPRNRPLRLLHAGLIYPEERDPRPFFAALSRLKIEGKLDATKLQVDLRAAGDEEYYTKILLDLGIGDLVHLLPPAPYQQLLQEAALVDALLLFQGVTCNHQIPAKAYEYLRLRRPILALTTREGDTAALLRDVGGATIVDMYDADIIYRSLQEFLDALWRGNHSLPNPEKSKNYARRNQAQELSHHLNNLIEAKV
jgi:glycosyltransferase involved in cell wall biosynthesis